MKTIPVNLPGTRYSIFVTGDESEWEGILAPFASSRPAIVLTTARVARFCLKPFQKGVGRLGFSLRPLLLPDGERFKNISTVSRAYRGLMRLQADRSTLLFLLGGGVLGDLGGFVAATFLRGLPFIQVPTTLVGQVDSSIGGKLGVDLPEGKNLVGLFQQPKGVLSHIPFLKTLPTREIVGGLAEVLKYGAIEDPSLLDIVLREQGAILKRDTAILSEIVERSARIKARFVEQDERETTGLRRVLNFGHTFGHALERLTGYRRLHHGEAVAIGMSITGKISARLGVCLGEEAERLRRALEEVGLPTAPPPFARERWRRTIEVDKKSEGGMIHFVFLKRIGEVVVKPISPTELVRLL